MAAHARLKNEFTEDEKYHNLMTWLKAFSCCKIDILFRTLNKMLYMCMACQTLHYLIFLYFNSIFFIVIVYFFICIQFLFIAIACFYICIQYLFISIYVFRFYSIFDHLYSIINDLYVIVFPFYSMTSIYIPKKIICILYYYICIV